MRSVGSSGRARTRKSELKANRSEASKRRSFFDNVSPGMRFGTAAFLLCALAVAVYSNSMQNGFVWDDHQQIAMNSALRPDVPLLHLFSADVRGATRKDTAGPEARGKINYYRPFQMLTYRVVADFFGFEPRSFHAVSLGFHLAAVLLAFACFHALTGRMGVAFAAASLFALHPIHSEAVDWISALPDIGCRVFFLLAFLFFRLAQNHTAQSHMVKRLCFLAASCTAFAAALLWKETAIVFPLVIVAYALCLGEGRAFPSRIGNAVKLSLLYWCILAAYFFLRLRVLGFLVISQRNWVFSRVAFALTALNLLMEYWWKLLAPVHLNAYYVFSSMRVRSFHDPRAIAAVVFLAVAIGAIWYGARRTPVATFAALWVFVCLVPVLNVYAVGRNVFTERYLYLPSVGFCLLVVLVAVRAGHWIPVRFRSLVSASALAVVLLLFAVQTLARNPDWRDDATLFTRTLESSPNAPFVQNMVAAVQLKSRFGESVAEVHYLRAISLAEDETPPDRLETAIAYEGLASIYADRSDIDRALRMLDQVRIADPEDPEVDGERGLILIQAGRWAEAEAALRKAVITAPDDPNVLNALGLLAWQHSNHLDEAASYFSRALAVHTEADDFSASLHDNLGAVYGEQGRFFDAIQQFSIAIEIAPNDPQYHTSLGTAYEAVGRINEARAEFEAALALTPDFNPARDALQHLPTQ